MLKFNTNTWHYKAFKFWHEDIGEHYVPEKTNLCSYSHGVMFGSFMYLFLKSMKTLFLCIFILVWPVFAVFALLAGRKPFSLWPNDWKPYKPFFTLFGKPMHIMQVVAPVATVCIAMIILADLPVSFSVLEAAAVFLLAMTPPVIVTVILYRIGDISIEDYNKDNNIDSDKYLTYSRQEPNLFVEMLKAKKQKICPLVEFNNID